MDFAKEIVSIIGKFNFEKILKGIRAYVISPSNPSLDLVILKTSLMNCFGEVKDKYYECQEDGVQLYDSYAFEEVDILENIEPDLLIHFEFIN